MLAGVGLALMALEVGVRLLPSPYPYLDPMGLTCDPDLGWRGQPNYQTTFATDGYTHTLTHNEQGFHDETHHLTKPPDTLRILLLGDSFTRNHHVNETETLRHVLQNQLNSQTSRQIEVISAGVSGWGTGQEWRYYQLEGQKYQPDLVLLMFYLGNDMVDSLPGHAMTIAGQNCYAPYFVICDNQFDPTPWPYAPGLTPNPCSPLSQWGHTFLGQLYLHSHLYRQLEPLLIAHQPRPEKLHFYNFYLETASPQVATSWQIVLALIKQLNHEVRQQGAAFAVVVIPPAEVVYFPFLPPAKQAETRQAIPELQGVQSLDFPNQKLAHALAEEQIEVFDLQPWFSEHIAQTGEAVYFPQDKHWNVAGNRLAAEGLAQWLTPKLNPIPPN